MVLGESGDIEIEKKLMTQEKRRKRNQYNIYSDDSVREVAAWYEGCLGFGILATHAGGACIQDLLVRKGHRLNLHDSSRPRGRAA
jgi:hypothetical protein